MGPPWVLKLLCKGEGQCTVHIGHQELKWLLLFAQMMYVHNDSPLKYIKKNFLKSGYGEIMLHLEAGFCGKTSPREWCDFSLKTGFQGAEWELQAPSVTWCEEV